MIHVSFIFSALSDPCRLEIVEKLMRDGETPAGTICEMFEISGPAVSRHLSVLHQAGLVSRRVAGKQRLYSVRPEAIRQVSDWTLDHRKFWGTSLDRIEASLREDT
ncbi:ArsR/SmtB family transcription factor [Mesorhizobium sp. 10J20-29]